MNTIILIGNLGKDPQIKQLKNDSQVCNFPLATSETYNKNGEKITDVTWHNIEAWDKAAATLHRYLKKGSRVAITGVQRHEAYEKDGKTQYMSKVRVKSFEFMDTAPNSKGENASEQNDDNLPF